MLGETRGRGKGEAIVLPLSLALFLSLLLLLVMTVKCCVVSMIPNAAATALFLSGLAAAPSGSPSPSGGSSSQQFISSAVPPSPFAGPASQHLCISCIKSPLFDVLSVGSVFLTKP